MTDDNILRAACQTLSLSY